MEPDLFRFKVVIVALTGVATFFAVFVLQRVYISIRTRRLAGIEPRRVCPLRDGAAFVAAVVLGAAAVAGVCALSAYKDFATPSPDNAIREIYVAEARDGRLTLQIYDPGPEDYFIAGPQRVFSTYGTSINVLVRRVAFRSWVSWTGQPDLAVVTAVEGRYAPGLGETAREPSREMLHTDEGCPSSWPFAESTDVEALHAPDTLRQGDVLRVTMAPDGRVMLAVVSARAK